MKHKMQKKENLSITVSRLKPPIKKGGFFSQAGQMEKLGKEG